MSLYGDRFIVSSMEHTTKMKAFISLLKTHQVRYKTRDTKWGRTVTIPFKGPNQGNTYVFEDVQGRIGVTSSWDDPRHYVCYPTVEEAWRSLVEGGNV